MRTLIYSESPMNPLSIERQLYRAGLAFEKHHWTFLTTYYPSPTILFEYTSANSNGVRAASKEKFVSETRSNGISPLMDYLSPKATPQPPLHFTMLYEKGISLRTNDSQTKVAHQHEQSLEQSLIWRFVETTQSSLFLAFKRRVMPPRNPAPKSTMELVELILGEPWQGENNPGLVPLLTPHIRQRALIALGTKGFSDLYILAIPSENNLSVENIATLSDLTGVDNNIAYRCFYSLIQACQWLLTTHNNLPGYVPYCFYSSQNIRPTLQKIYQQIAIETNWNLLETNDILALPIQPEQLNCLTLQETATYPRPKIANEVYVSDIIPLETLNGLTTLSLADTEVTQIDEILSYPSLNHLNLDGTPFRDTKTLAKLTWLKSLSLKHIQLKTVKVLTSLQALQQLTLSRMPFEDGLTPLTQLTSLESLNLDNMKIADFGGIDLNKSIKDLSLKKTSLVNLNGVERLTSLEILSIEQTEISNLQPLSACKTLRELTLSYSEVTDISPITSLKNLVILKAAYLGIADWRPLQHLKLLETLIISYSTLDDLSFLNALTNLKQLEATDLEPIHADLVNLPSSLHLPQLEDLNLYGSPIDNINPLIKLVKLVNLDLGGTGIQDFSPLADMYWLTSLWLNYTAITDISWFHNQMQLQELHLAGSQIADISPLKELLHLKKLDLRNTSIEDFRPLLSLPKLEELNVSSNTINDELYQALSQHHHLVE